MKRIALVVVFILFLIIGVILDLSPISVPDGIDKFYHFAGFALLTFLAILNFIEFFGEKYINSFLIFLMTFGGVFAGISEFLQKFTAVRSCDAIDWVINLCGITFVCIITFLVYSKQRKEFEINQASFDIKDLPVLS